MNIGETKKFWNSQAMLGADIGMQDVIAKQLEIRAISSYVEDGMRILDAGCGSGATALDIASRFNVDILAIDYAGEMVRTARRLAQGQELKGRVTFRTGNVLQPKRKWGWFDLIYTERTIINLTTWEEQKRAITNLIGLLKPGGIYVMCENSQDGLDSINRMREKIGIYAVEPPWHNRYIRDSEIAKSGMDSILYDYSAGYYFLSRVVNAYAAMCEERDPEYDSHINRLALYLEPRGDYPIRGQGNIWTWRRGD